MSENTKKPTAKKQEAVKNNKVNAKADTKANTKTEETGKKKLSSRAIALIVSISLILVIAITVGVVLIVDYVKNDKGFNYLKSDLSKYIEINGDYKNLDLSLNIAKPREEDVEAAILSIIAANKDTTPVSGYDKSYDPTVIGAGDKVYVWYRGYVLDDQGEKVYLSKLVNFANANAGALEIGSGGFYPGVEAEMVGVNTKDIPKFEKITSGRVRDGMVLYVSYTRYEKSGGVDNIKKETEAAIRIDLSSDVDAIFGKGFKEKLLLSEVGGSKWDFTTTCGDLSYEYANVKVEFATLCEDNPRVFSGYIPYNTPVDGYFNVDVYFEIYFDGIIDYDAPEFNDEFVQSKIDDGTFKITVEDLEEYDGNSISEKYYSYVAKVVNNVYEADYQTYLEEAIWTKILSMVTVKKYPAQKLEEIYKDYIYEVNYKFSETGGRIYTSDGTSYTTYSTVDEYAEAYYGTANYGVAWYDYCYLMAQNKVKERMILFYIMRNDNLLPTDSEFNEIYNTTVDQYLADYVKESLSYEGKNKADMTDSEYEAYVNTCKGQLFTLFSEEDFKETSYYLLLIEDIKAWEGIKVTTLDTPAENQ